MEVDRWLVVVVVVVVVVAGDEYFEMNPPELYIFTVNFVDPKFQSWNSPNDDHQESIIERMESGQRKLECSKPAQFRIIDV
jgi:hypothetical protein